MNSTKPFFSCFQQSWLHPVVQWMIWHQAVGIKYTQANNRLLCVAMGCTFQQLFTVELLLVCTCTRDNTVYCVKGTTSKVEEMAVFYCVLNKNLWPAQSEIKHSLGIEFCNKWLTDRFSPHRCGNPLPQFFCLFYSSGLHTANAGCQTPTCNTLVNAVLSMEEPFAHFIIMYLQIRSYLPKPPSLELVNKNSNLEHLF